MCTDSNRDVSRTVQQTWTPQDDEEAHIHPTVSDKSVSRCVQSLFDEYSADIARGTLNRKSNHILRSVMTATIIQLMSHQQSRFKHLESPILKNRFSHVYHTIRSARCIDPLQMQMPEMVNTQLEWSPCPRLLLKIAFE